MRTVADCRAYLWGDASAIDTRQPVDDAIAAARPALAAITDTDQLTAATAALFDRILALLLKTLPARAGREPALKFVRLALETHILASLHTTLFSHVATSVAHDDSTLNKVCTVLESQGAGGRAGNVRLAL